jgi:hypothetical protein
MRGCWEISWIRFVFRNGYLLTAGCGNNAVTSYVPSADLTVHGCRNSRLVSPEAISGIYLWVCVCVCACVLKKIAMAEWQVFTVHKRMQCAFGICLVSGNCKFMTLALQNCALQHWTVFGVWTEKHEDICCANYSQIHWCYCINTFCCGVKLFWVLGWKPDILDRLKLLGPQRNWRMEGPLWQTNWCASPYEYSKVG